MALVVDIVCDLVKLKREVTSFLGPKRESIVMIPVMIIKKALVGLSIRK